MEKRHRSLKLLLPLMLLMEVSPTPTPPSAIRVISQGVENQFPDSLAFSIRARSDGGNITHAAVYFQIGWDQAERLGQAAPFTPQAEVSVTHVWDTTAETVPPFIEITYYWHIIDSVGNELMTTPIAVEYEDRTHAWRAIRDPRVIVYWYDQPDDFGVALYTAAAEGYDHVARITGTTTERPARVVIYNNQRDFCAFYAPRTCQEWIGGETFSGLTVQWGTDLGWFVYDVVPHELAHVFYGEIFRDTWMPIPTWFNEGIAVYNERTDHATEIALVRSAASTGDLIPLRLMATQASGLAHDAIHLWYAEAYSLVAYIAEVHGEEKLGEVIMALVANQPIEEAIQGTLGMDLIEYEMAWREWLGYPVEALPTPVSLGPMEITPFGLPTAPRGASSATAAPAEATPAETLATPEVADEPRGVSLPCVGTLGAWLLVAFVLIAVRLRPL